MDQLPFRVQRIFNGLFSPGDNTQPQDNSMPPPSPQGGSGLNDADIYNAAVQQPQMSSDPNDIIKSLLGGQNTATDKLNQLLATQPTHSQYEPGFGRKLLGGLISINDPQAGQNFTDKKFNEANQEWNAKLKPIQDIATAEKGINANNRLAGIGMLRDQQANQRNDTLRRGQDLKDQQTKANLDEKYYFTDMKYNRPEVLKFADDSGDLYTLTKGTGEITPMINPETGLHMKGDKLPQAEQMNLKHNYDLAKIAASGSENRTTAGVKGGIAKDVNAAKGEVTKSVNEAAIPGKIAVKSATPGATVKPGDEQIRVIHPGDDKHPAGTPGFIKKKDLRDALAQGFVVVPDKQQQQTGVGLNLKPLVPKVGF